MTGISDSPSWRYAQSARHRRAFRLAKAARRGALAMSALSAKRRRGRLRRAAVQRRNADAHRVRADGALCVRALLAQRLAARSAAAGDGGSDRRTPTPKAHALRFQQRSQRPFSRIARQASTPTAAHLCANCATFLSHGQPAARARIGSRARRSLRLGRSLRRRRRPCARRRARAAIAIRCSRRRSTYVRLRLRSLDDMVYYVGELMRAGSDASRTRASRLKRSSLCAPQACAAAGKACRSSASCRTRAQHGRIYAAEVALWRRALSTRARPSGAHAAREAEAVRARTHANEGDRSSSVLSLIAEILALNQSPDAIRAPSRLIAE